MFNAAEGRDGSSLHAAEVPPPPKLARTAAEHPPFFNSWQEFLFCFFFDFWRCKLSLILVFVFRPAVFPSLGQIPDM